MKRCSRSSQRGRRRGRQQSLKFGNRITAKPEALKKYASGFFVGNENYAAATVCPPFFTGEFFRGSF
jgi:hypothetical protein